MASRRLSQARVLSDYNIRAITISVLGKPSVTRALQHVRFGFARALQTRICDYWNPTKTNNKLWTSYDYATFQFARGPSEITEVIIKK